MLCKNKKGIGEVVSFVLLTLLIVIASSTSYFYSKSNFDELRVDRDVKFMNHYLKNIYYEIDSLKKYDGSTLVSLISFETGTLKFDSNSISYQSLEKFSSGNICFDVLCYEDNGGYEKFLVNFTDITFSQNLSIVPGNYNLVFEYVKNESKIIVLLK